MAEEATEPPVEPEVAEGKLPTSSTCPFLPMTLLWPSLFSLCGALPWSLSMRCSRPDTAILAAEPELQRPGSQQSGEHHKGGDASYACGYIGGSVSLQPAC